MGQANQISQACGASTCEGEAPPEASPEESAEMVEETLEDVRLIDSLAQNDQAVIVFACAAWKWAQGYSQAAAIAAAALLIQCLRHWATAGGDVGEISLVTRQMLFIVKDISEQLASPTPAEAAMRGRKPPPNRKARK